MAKKLGAQQDRRLDVATAAWRVIVRDGLDRTSLRAIASASSRSCSGVRRAVMVLLVVDAQNVQPLPFMLDNDLAECVGCLGAEREPDQEQAFAHRQLAGNAAPGSAPAARTGQSYLVEEGLGKALRAELRFPAADQRLVRGDDIGHAGHQSLHEPRQDIGGRQCTAATSRRDHLDGQSHGCAIKLQPRTVGRRPTVVEALHVDGNRRCRCRSRSS